MAFLERSRKRALLALAFAGGTIQSTEPVFSDESVQVPAPSKPPAVVSQNDAQSFRTLVQEISNNQKESSEDRAFTLLYLAQALLEGEDRTTLFRTYKNAHIGVSSHRRQGNDLRFLLDSTYRVSSSQWPTNISQTVKNIGVKTDKDIIADNENFADEAAHASLKEIQKASNKFAQMNLCYLATRIFAKTGNTVDQSRCNAFLEDGFKSCESTAQDAEATRSAISVLTSMSNSIITVEIPDLNPADSPNLVVNKIRPYSAQDFETAEQLRLRAARIADQLPASDDLRRKIHRDLALWYKALERKTDAEKEKQILFELVGFKSDILLYGQVGGCGHIVWWEKEQLKFAFDCGMG